MKVKAVVVGGGVIGLAVADELTRRGVRVVLLEKSPQAGRQASWAAAGILAPQSEAQAPGPFLDLLLAGAQMVPEAVARLESLTGLNTRHRIGGMLMPAFSETEREELQKKLRWQAAAGLSAEELGVAQIRRMEPALGPGVLGGLYWAQSAQLDPRRFVEAYEGAARLQGADLRFNIPALRVRLKGNRAAGVETSSGLVESDWVIHCAGAWAGEGLGLPFTVPVVPARGQMLRFRTRAPLVRGVVKSARAYLVQRSDDCLVAGTTLEYAGFAAQPTPEGRQTIRSGAVQLAPAVEGLEPEDSWAGLRPDTPDHLPVLGPTPVEGLLLACGHFRNGILLAPLTGRLIAERILGVRSAVDVAPFGLSRFMVG